MSLNLNYSQTTGVYTKDNGVVIVPPGHAWAGNDSYTQYNPDHLPGKNNPLLQDVHCIGPAPQGLWRFGEWAFTKDDAVRLGYPPNLGLGICHMTQIGGENFGRDGIYMHGPSVDPAKHGQESLGCFVVEHDYRIGQIAALKPDTLTVTP